MTARSIPAEPDFASDAERVVWTALRDQLPDDAVLLPGRRFTDRDGDCEADVVVAWPGVGVAVVEVKGGHVSLDARGVWTQSGRSSTHEVDPVRQAQRCRYALRSYLEAHPSWGRGHVRAQHLVAFPYSRVPADVETSDCPRWMVLDERDLTAAPTRIADAVTGSGGGSRVPDADDVDALVGCLVGRPQSQRDLVAGQVAARERHADLLTERQASVLDHIRLLSRVEVRGGAGSGKTWLAGEQARRLSDKGLRVGLLAYSRGLTMFLQERVRAMPAKQRPAYVGTFHNLGVGWGARPGADDDPAYWEAELPRAMVDLAAGLPVEDRFDAFVVDEGQDFDDAWWPALLAGLKDPATGGLFVFADAGQRVFARQGRPPVDLVPVPLDENLRNTKPIAQSFSSLVTEQQRIRGGAGVPVRFVSCSSDEALDVADDVIDEYLKADTWDTTHLALLTTGRRHPVQVERQSEGHEEYWRSFWSDDVFYGHVLGFKGLERPAVVLAVNGFGRGADERAREKLYVGLSRARDLLVVVGDPELIRAKGGEGVARRLGIS